MRSSCLARVACVYAAVFAVSVTTSFAQAWNPGGGVLSVNPLNTRVGIGTNVPATRLHINGDGLWPQVDIRLTQDILPGMYGNTNTERCRAGGDVAVSHGFGHFANFVRAGDVVLRSIVDPADTSTGTCARDVVLAAATTRSAIRFGTGTDAIVPGGVSTWQRMVLDAPSGDTRLELQAVNIEGMDKNSIMRFSRADGWSRTAIEDTWAIGMDVRHGLPSQYNAGTSAFRIGKSTPLSTSFDQDFFTVLNDGRVLIGDPLTAAGGTGIISGRDLKDAKLQVDGTVLASEYLAIAPSNWADFVFADDYNLMPLHELEQSIKENKHLPNIPSAQEVQASGTVNLSEMQVKLLQKVEELTLYVIEQQKQIKSLETKLAEKK